MELVIAGGLTAAVLVLVFFAMRKKPDNAISEEMTGTEFEDYCAELLSQSGYTIEEMTDASGDFGADIIISQGSERTAVQCKRYSRPVGVRAVQEVIASKEHYHCTGAAVMTNSVFTRQAQTLAAESGVSLWDGEFIASLEKSDTKSPLDLAPVVFALIISSEIVPFDFYVDKKLHHEGEFSSPLSLSLPYGKHTLTVKIGRKKASLKIIIRDKGRRVFAIGTVKNRPTILEIGI